MSKKIVIIGNNGSGKEAKGGDTVKIRLYKQVLESHEFSTFVIDLQGRKKNFVKILLEIKRAIQEECTLLIMAGPKGSRILIPIINFLNRNIKTRIVYCPIGTGTINQLTKKLNHKQLKDFLSCSNFYNIKDKRMATELKKITIIIPQSEMLTKLYKEFYSLTNCETLLNFRDFCVIRKKYNTEKPLKICFVSRIRKDKGIFDLIEVINNINIKNNKVVITLDIFGPNQLSHKENFVFFSLLNDFVRYRGHLNNDRTTSLISNYDLFCLPSNFYGEGTPGVIIESMIAGTPILTSSFPMVNEMIKDRDNGIIFNISDIADLEDKISFCLENFDLLERIGRAAQKDSERYLLKNSESKFIKFITNADL